jgi:ribonuclease HII
MNQLYRHDLAALKVHPSIIGIDEAGRGALAGPVVVVAVSLDYSYIIPNLNDSKKLSPSIREKISALLIESCRAYACEEVSSQYIDANNILQATLFGMRIAADKIALEDTVCYIDGDHIPRDMKQQAIAVVRGDGLYACIAAASVIAKVHRDALMRSLHEKYPRYGFDRNKGYGTEEHMDALEKYGPCPIHRTTFTMVRHSETAKICRQTLSSLPKRR